jgi:hypothetical protein
MPPKKKVAADGEATEGGVRDPIPVLLTQAPTNDTQIFRWTPENERKVRFLPALPYLHTPQAIR